MVPVNNPVSYIRTCQKKIFHLQLPKHKYEFEISHAQKKSRGIKLRLQFVFKQYNLRRNLLHLTLNSLSALQLLFSSEYSQPPLHISGEEKRVQFLLRIKLMVELISV